MRCSPEQRTCGSSDASTVWTTSPRGSARSSCWWRSTSSTPGGGGSGPTPAACDAGSTSRSGWSATPQVIFLDEPTTGLDTRSRQALWDVVSGLARYRVPCCSPPSTSRRPIGSPTGWRCSSGGRIVAQGSPAELKSRVGAEVLEIRGRRRVSAGGAPDRRLTGVGPPGPGGISARPSGRTPRWCSARPAPGRRLPGPDRGGVAHDRPRRDHAVGDARRHDNGRLTTSLLFIRRSLTHSIRDVDALIISIVLPVMLMLLFVYVFGGAIEHRRPTTSTTWCRASSCSARATAARAPQSASPRT